MEVWKVLWSDYLSWVVPVADFHVWLAMLQGTVGAVLPVMTLLRVIKRKSQAETVLCCLVPIVLVVVDGICSSLFFGSFLGEGFSTERTGQMKVFMATPDFFRAAFFVCLIFVFCSVGFFVLDHLVGKTTVLKLLVNLAFEYVYLVVFCVVGWDFLRGNGTLFQTFTGQQTKWFLYGLFLLLEKSIFYATCLLFSLLFSERKKVYSFGKYDTPQRWIRNYLSRAYRVYALMLFFFSVFFFVLVAPEFYTEEGINWTICFSLLIFSLVPAVLGLRFLFAAVFPKTLKNYQRILTWGHPEKIASMLYEELENRSPICEFPQWHGFITVHFVVVNLPRRIFYLPLYERTEVATDSCVRIYFKDGSRVRLRDYEGDMIRRAAKALNRRENEGSMLHDL